MIMRRRVISTDLWTVAVVVVEDCVVSNTSDVYVCVAKGTNKVA